MTPLDASGLSALVCTLAGVILLPFDDGASWAMLATGAVLFSFYVFLLADITGS